MDLFFHVVYFLLENDILWNFFSSYTYFLIKFYENLIINDIYLYFGFIKNFK